MVAELVGCARCGVPFDPRRPGQRYCSRRCAGATGAAKVTRRKPGTPPPGGCPVCHGPVPPWSGRGVPRVYCSRPCMRSDVNRRYNAAPEAVPPVAHAAAAEKPPRGLAKSGKGKLRGTSAAECPCPVGGIALESTPVAPRACDALGADLLDARIAAYAAMAERGLPLFRKGA